MADEKEANRHCVRLRTVGGARFQHRSFRRRHRLQNCDVLQCSSAAPRSCRATRKAVVHRAHRVSSLSKDCQFDGLLSDDPNVTKPNHRRASLPLDYRWLAGMKPKWYVNFKKQTSASASDQQDATTLEKPVDVGIPDDNANALENAVVLPCRVVSDDGIPDQEAAMNRNAVIVPCPVVSVEKSQDKETGVHKNAIILPLEVVSGTELTCHGSSKSSLLTLLTASSNSYHAAGIQSLIEKIVRVKPVASTFAESCEPRRKDGSYLLSDSASCCSFATQPLVSLTSSCEGAVVTDPHTQTEAVESSDDKRLTDVDQSETVGSADTPELSSDCRGRFHNISGCCSLRCDCLSFCDSPSSEYKTAEPQQENIATDGLDACARYTGCDGSYKVTRDLKLVGAHKTVTVPTEEPVSCEVDGQLLRATDEHEDVMDNICVDCGCEMTQDDVTKCLFSVPICDICSGVNNDNVPSTDGVILADHDYARLVSNYCVRPSPLKEIPFHSPTAFRHHATPDVDVINGITFISFPTKSLMHRYMSTRPSSYDLSAGSWLAGPERCERIWHKPHRAVWFGRMRHRHLNRFSARNRLHEQIELGLIKPLSTQSSPDLLGIKLRSSLPQNGIDKTVRKLKCRNSDIPSGSHTERPTRLVAVGQRYCFTRFRRSGSALQSLSGSESVNLMKLTQEQADEALQPVHVPPVITRNECSQPGNLHLPA